MGHRHTHMDASAQSEFKSVVQMRQAVERTSGPVIAKMPLNAMEHHVCHGKIHFFCLVLRTLDTAGVLLQALQWHIRKSDFISYKPHQGKNLRGWLAQGLFLHVVYLRLGNAERIMKCIHTIPAPLSGPTMSQ